MTVRVAAVDCGTHSLRLLVADVDPGRGVQVDVERRVEVVRLGAGVDATGAISPEAMDRALAVTAGYARIIARTGAVAVRCVATSATRDARNAAAFTAGLRALLGVEPEVVSGDEEARLSFLGATRGLDAGRGPVLVVDLGGGSTEFVRGDGDRIEAAVSVDVGSVRLTERHLRGDPPAASGLVAARGDVTAALDEVARAVDLDRVRTVIGVAGTVLTVAAHARYRQGGGTAAVAGRALPADAVRAACADLVASPRERLVTLAHVHPGRVDVIAAGALIWDLVVERVSRPAGKRGIIASDHDILDGITWTLAGA